jgi:hypothetical protein
MELTTNYSEGKINTTCVLYLPSTLQYGLDIVEKNQKSNVLYVSLINLLGKT